VYALPIGSLTAVGPEVPQVIVVALVKRSSRRVIRPLLSNRTKLPSR
jgi:hypothetical protein